MTTDTNALDAKERPKGGKNDFLLGMLALLVLLFLVSIVVRGAEIRVERLDDTCRTVGMTYSFKRGLCVEAGSGRLVDPTVLAPAKPAADAPPR